VTAVDLPEVLGTTRRAVEAAGLTARFRFRAGDMFTAELSDAAFDMIILGNICHLFGPDTNRALLRRLRPALRPAGTLAIVDALPSGDPAQRQFLSLYSLGLRMRTSAGAVHPLETYTTWTQDCGYTDLSATPLSQAPPLALLTCHLRALSGSTLSPPAGRVSGMPPARRPIRRRTSPQPPRW
jgi:SAM-dependent methyltransferase